MAVESANEVGSPTEMMEHCPNGISTDEIASSPNKNRVMSSAVMGDQPCWSPLKNKETLAASFHARSPGGSPAVSNAVIKSLQRSGSAYLSSTGEAASSNATTSKIVDQALNVVHAHHRRRHGSSGGLINGGSNHGHSSSRRHFLEPPPSPLGLSESSLSCSEWSNRSRRSSSSCSPRVGAPPVDDLAAEASIETEEAQQQESLHVPPPPASLATFCAPGNAPSFRKIAKKRRKENDRDGMDRSSFHHTKSSKEYLRKAQEALMRQKKGDGESASDRLSRQQQEPNALSPRSNFARQSNLRTTLHNPERFGSFCAGKDGSDSDVPPVPPVARRNRSCNDVVVGVSAPETVATAPAPAAATDLGYEDPDAVAATREPNSRPIGSARRRGSVTKFSFQAAHAAKAATERILQLQGLSTSSLSQKGLGSCSTRSDNTSTVTGRRAPRRTGGMIKVKNERVFSEPTIPQEVANDDCVEKAPIRQRSIPLGDDWERPEKQNLGYEEVDMKGDRPEAFATPSLNMSSNQYGYEDPDASKATSNSLGYEDPDASKATFDALGYENPDKGSRPHGRRHPRPQRRGSVTKFSIQAAQKAVEAACMAPEDEKKNAVTFDAETPPVHNKTTLDPLEVSVRDESNPVDDEPAEIVLQLKPPAPSRFSNGKNQPRQSPYFSQGRSHFARQHSGEDLVEPFASGKDVYHGLSPRRRSSVGEHSTSSRGLRRPVRSNSILSQNSALSFEDDADSVANDLESLCSIHDRGTMDVPLVPPPPPIMSPLGTPKSSVPRSRSGSLRGALMGMYSGGSALERTGSCHSNNSHYRLEPQRRLSTRGSVSNLPIIAFPADSDMPLVTGGSTGFMAAPVKRTPSSSSSNHCSMQPPSAAPSFSSTSSDFAGMGNISSGGSRRSSFAA